MKRAVIIAEENYSARMISSGWTAIDDSSAKLLDSATRRKRARYLCVGSRRQYCESS